jgi:hydroxyethylthiazole kinase-like uncharacterized protein yjeF
LPEADGELGKVGRGQVLVVGGSVQNPGAVLLAGIAALRAGAGRLQIATASAVAPLLAISVPEARVLGLRAGGDGELTATSCRAIQGEMEACDALLIGPGMMTSHAAADLLRACFRRPRQGAVVVDAGALTVFSQTQAAHGAGAILTPHPGEMANMLDLARAVVLERPLEIAREAATQLRSVVVLKGAETFVAAPDGRVFHNTRGGVGLGTSGSGDVLAGLITGLCARGADALQAAVWGVHLHALAGERLAKRLGPLGFLARELSVEVPELLRASAATRGARSPGKAPGGRKGRAGAG